MLPVRGVLYSGYVTTWGSYPPRRLRDSVGIVVKLARHIFGLDKILMFHPCCKNSVGGVSETDSTSRGTRGYRVNAWEGRAESWFSRVDQKTVVVFCDPVCWDMDQSLAGCGNLSQQGGGRVAVGPGIIWDRWDVLGIPQINGRVEWSRLSRTQVA